ncbi:RNA polymerase sigma factor [Undibacterium macrobrachii]|jgi:RNA polymerase sigma-70 factor (ECF subfamily)|uniref:RNA polymerase sigma factor n=1 Tax=Undibacterium macrobrachii TaxID=1119058 RepID=A0ABQ2XKH3_9BURK|nr:sigma-70 family RNA polymerase sigma factor [Undibacterium macrobrachii]GGX21083.1 RNA polymerase sigma factor [Undibacterium macrobrachii]
MQSSQDKAAEARIDQALVVRARLNKDHRAFEMLVRRHQGMVRALLRRLTKGDHAAADDLAQETFLIAWRKLDQFRGDARFSTWLYRIAYTHFLKYADQFQRTHDELAAVEEQSDYDENLASSAPTTSQYIDLKIDFERALQSLNPNEQLVLLHCVQLDLSHEEVAQILGMSLGTVKSNATRGKAKLQTWLDAWKNKMKGTNT